LLDATNPNNMRFDIEFGTVLHQDFAEFPTYLRTGKTWPLADRPGEIQRLYVEATLDDYPVLINVLLPRMAPEILTRLRQNQGEWQDNGPPSILDVGTGAGFALVYYAKQFPNAHITGLDINHSSVEQAKYNIAQAANLQNNHIQVHEGDVTKLKNEPKYDLIIINLALHEIALPDYPHLFDLLYNALRPGGILLISDYHFPNLAAVPTYRYPGYQLLLSLLLHLALVGNTLVPSQKVIELLKAKFPGEGNVAETHHPIEERKVIVAKKV
jgi:predicted O-methyltransferase YrrM